jgi:FtsH-binding integral membrane protein
MSEQDANQTLRDYAKKSLKKKAEFKQYLWVYLAVSLLTSAIWFLTTPEDYFWPVWVIFGMGIGAVFAGIDAYGSFGKKPITESDIDAEVERLKRKG